MRGGRRGPGENAHVRQAMPVAVCVMSSAERDGPTQPGHIFIVSQSFTLQRSTALSKPPENLELSPLSSGNLVPWPHTHPVVPPDLDGDITVSLPSVNRDTHLSQKAEFCVKEPTHFSDSWAVRAARIHARIVSRTWFQIQPSLSKQKHPV